jgi:H/ACA ribonucleoprotein complex non-core subunit NAF1
MLRRPCPVQAPENGRAVSEGTPICLGDRAPVGRVEDVFGPVMEPLYSLRYACGPSMPSGITQGAELYCIERLTDYILPQELYIKGYVGRLLHV